MRDITAYSADFLHHHEKKDSKMQEKNGGGAWNFMRRISSRDVCPVNISERRIAPAA